MAEKIRESILCFFFVFIIYFSAICVSAQTCDNTTGTFKPDSLYDKNRRFILSSLASNVTAHNGYFNGSIGLDPDRVYATGMCAPGAEPDVCSRCIETTSESLLRNCLNETRAFSWSAEENLCLVRYSSRSLSGLLVMAPRGALYNTQTFTIRNQTDFDYVCKKLLFGLIAKTTSSSGNNSSKYYAHNESLVPFYGSISSWMQCTPDVSPNDCRTCLQRNVIDYENCCREHLGGLISRPSCFFRWELYPSPPSVSNLTTINKKADSRNSGGIIAAIVVVVTIILIVVGLVIFKRRNQKQEIELPTESVQFDLKTIEAATSNFSERNKLGQGGFGEVYKGMLMNGTEVAVKRLSKKSEQGDTEFKNEVIVVAKLQHRNLVRLLGFSLHGEEKLLVYEFVPNKSLDYFLFDPKKRIQLDWGVRHNIIHGITRGILYLHHDSRLKIIHRDLKASNILLDADMSPKIADFGMARIFGMDQNVANTARVVGTLSGDYGSANHCLRS
ncbi:cysteine-rich receptor-like protein kinase 18 isoform X5 [Brassica napus]|uniref:cysteine-rich receptor-like protein kinase 18 isoform X5 n=1 Tax=Brassica napus TaxID=3708 RepID=UPI002078AD4A|nr:cysteine-rich receptor-like protein kinase 18 isoform X5 [Brassica napus]